MNLEKLFLFLPVSIRSKFGIFGDKKLVKLQIHLTVKVQSLLQTPGYVSPGLRLRLDHFHGIILH